MASIGIVILCILQHGREMPPEVRPQRKAASRPGAGQPRELRNGDLQIQIQIYDLNITF